MSKIEAIKHAISEANFFRSKLTPEALGVPGFTSLKIRHLMNNLGAISTNFLEVGSHKGGTFCSAAFQNPNLQFITAIDNFSEFSEGSPFQELMNNVGKFKATQSFFKMLMVNCWEVQKESLPQGIDFYMYDGNHGLDEQKMACTHFIESMANEFIFCVDDYSVWPQVKQGTKEGIALAELRYKLKNLPGFTVLFEQELYNGVEGDNMGFHMGFWVALCKKS